MPDKLDFVLIAAFPAGPFQTNCYLIATDEDSPVVVIDPGMGAADQVDAVVAQYRLRVAGVLLTHGHMDHLASAAEVCRRHQVDLWVHPADRHWLRDPFAGFGVEMAAQFGMTGEYQEPDTVHEVSDGDVLEVGGLSWRVSHAPGHTPGSVLYTLTVDDATTAVFTGDVLFAGSVGRTDLAGGDARTMATTLREVILGLPDEYVVLPGHGPQTTIGAERGANPYLSDRMLSSLEMN